MKISSSGAVAMARFGAVRLSRGSRGLRLAILVGSVVLSLAGAAEARSRGLAGGGCEGCHGNSDNSVLSASPLEAELGETVSLRFTVTDPDAEVGGLFIEVEDLPGVSVGSGSSLAVVANGVSHTAPKNFSGGSVSFDVNYRVPTAMGSTRFNVWSLAANGNGKNSGDEGNSASFDLVYGCEPQTYYRDLDGDGFGRTTSSRVHCAGQAPEGYAASGDDCDDNTTERYPGATEFCNRRDDDCDEEVDENALPVLLFPDSDGDGYYSFEESQSEDTLMGCVPYPGYGDQPGDCDPESAAVNPGAEEVCDMIFDEDCDGRVDERVRPICGEGWCRRESLTCSLDDCTPGEPSPETCNFLDDDCDADVDEGDLCPPGESCLAGECRPAGVEGDGTPNSPEESSRTPRASGCQAAPFTFTPGASLWLLPGLLALALIGRRRVRAEEKAARLR